jgi:hypothetical protein
MSSKLMFALAVDVSGDVSGDMSGGRAEEKEEAGLANCEAGRAYQEVAL